MQGARRRAGLQERNKWRVRQIPTRRHRNEDPVLGLSVDFPSIFFLFLCACPLVAAAAEIMVFAPGGVRSALLGAATSFERETGNKVNFTFGTGGGIQKQVAGGAPGDVTVLPVCGDHRAREKRPHRTKTRGSRSAVSVWVSGSRQAPHGPQSALRKSSVNRCSPPNPLPMPIPPVAGPRARTSQPWCSAVLASRSN